MTLLSAYLLSLGRATPPRTELSRLAPLAKLLFFSGVRRLARRESELNQDADLVNRFVSWGEFSFVSGTESSF